MNGAANVPFSYFVITVVAASDLVFVVSGFLLLLLLDAWMHLQMQECISAS